MLPKSYIGTAAWTIPKDHRPSFTEGGSHLEMYGGKLNAVEINSSFYRDHKPATYERWAASVPEDFRFSVKLSKVFTHQQKLKVGEKNLGETLRGIMQLKSKLGCLLVQIPPSLQFDMEDANGFFEDLRSTYEGPVAFETRHASWNTTSALDLFQDFRLASVLADPNPTGERPKTFLRAAELVYLRLHGSPEIYKSDYEKERLLVYAEQIETFLTSHQQVWCIFDNTTFGHATGNALELKGMIDADLA
jgi:uncharacterized protein YecE (DUF72 family)